MESNVHKHKLASKALDDMDFKVFGRILKALR
jgi:hypothetical protein